jgi:hypothetical protein
MLQPELQQLFDKAAAAVIAQGRPSRSDDLSDDGTVCRYRLDMTPECPIRCAVGHLIPDEVYDPRMDHGSTGGFGLSGVLNAIGAGEHYNALRALQAVHDQAIPDDNFVAEFKREAREVFARFNLDTKVLDDA